jgi:polyvinyl alcohol dehydrogenase (cytochrome)
VQRLDQPSVSAVYGSELILGDGWILTSSAVGARVFAVDRNTGTLVWSTQVDTDPAAVITSSPVIYRGVAYLGISSKGEAGGPGTFRGAVNAATGTLLWKTYTVPSNNSNSDSNKPGYYSGNAVWSSSPVIDPARGLLYVGTGNNYTVALKLNDGTVAWADHTLDTDLWTVPQPSGPDFDFGAGPNLFTTRDPVTGRARQLLGIGKVAWQAVVGPAGNGGNGGIEYGTATDGRRIYAAEGDTARIPYTLGGSPAATSTPLTSAPPTASSTPDRWLPPAPICTPWTPRPGRSCGASPAAAR